VLRDHKLRKYALPELLDRLQSAKARHSAKSDLKKIRATIIELTTRHENNHPQMNISLLRDVCKISLIKSFFEL